jgi:hypothetical protein
MGVKKGRQTFEKLRREQIIRKRREDKAQRKAEARAAKAGSTEGSPAEPAGHQDPPPTTTVEPTENGSGPHGAPSRRHHEQ